MQIKDVEKLTGLTAKSIRFYETKGLIDVERNEENDYRNYSEDNVIQLKLIKMFRYLDFSIEEIRELLNKDEAGVKEALKEKAEKYSKQKEVCEDRQNMCLTMAKDYKNSQQFVDEYSETIEFLESDEMAELVDNLKEFGYPSLAATIGMTMIFLGPILWLFINIYDRNYDSLMLNAVFALTGVAFITANWIYYITQYRRYKTEIKKKNRETGLLAVVILAGGVFGIVALVTVLSGMENLMAPAGYLFCEQHQLAGIALVVLLLIGIILACIVLYAKFARKSEEQLEKINDLIFIWNHLGKFRPIAVVLWIVGLYCCLTSVTYVTEDTVVYHSPLHPLGITYKYTDIEEIKTGFGDKTFSLMEYERKDSFYYQIKVDGKTITFHVPSPNDDIQRYMEDSYLELEEFDKALVILGIPKIASDKNHDKCDLDKQYVDRFLRIVGNSKAKEVPYANTNT